MSAPKRPAFNVAAGMVRVMQAEARVKRVLDVASQVRTQVGEAFPADHPFRTEMEKVMGLIEEACK